MRRCFCNERYDTGNKNTQKTMFSRKRRPKKFVFYLRISRIQKNNFEALQPHSNTRTNTVDLEGIRRQNDSEKK